MKRLQIPKGYSENDWDKLMMSEDLFASLDWKEIEGTSFLKFDELLRPFGLELVTMDTESDTYHFTISKKGVKCKLELLLEKMAKRIAKEQKATPPPKKRCRKVEEVVCPKCDTKLTEYDWGWICGKCNYQFKKS